MTQKASPDAAAKQRALSRSILVHAPAFKTGRQGTGLRFPHEWMALRHLVELRDPEFFRELAGDTDLPFEARLYGLCGLQALDTALFETEFARWAPGEHRVEAWSGSIAGQKDLADLLKKKGAGSASVHNGGYTRIILDRAEGELPLERSIIEMLDEEGFDINVTFRVIQHPSRRGQLSTLVRTRRTTGVTLHSIEELGPRGVHTFEDLKWLITTHENPDVRKHAIYVLCRIAPWLPKSGAEVLEFMDGLEVEAEELVEMVVHFAISMRAFSRLGDFESPPFLHAERIPESVPESFSSSWYPWDPDRGNTLLVLGELPDKTLERLVSLAVDGVEVSRLSDALLFSGIRGVHRFERLLRSGDARLAELGAMRIEEIAKFRPSTWSVVRPWMVELASDTEAPGHEVGRSFLEWLERLGVRD